MAQTIYLFPSINTGFIVPSACSISLWVWGGVQSLPLITQTPKHFTSSKQTFLNSELLSDYKISLVPKMQIHWLTACAICIWQGKQHTYFWHTVDKMGYLLIHTIGCDVRSWSHINKINLDSLKKFCWDDRFERSLRFTWRFPMANLI